MTLVMIHPKQDLMLWDRTWANTVKVSTDAKKPFGIFLVVKNPLACAFLSVIAQICKSHKTFRGSLARDMMKILALWGTRTY